PVLLRLTILASTNRSTPASQRGHYPFYYICFSDVAFPGESNALSADGNHISRAFLPARYSARPQPSSFKPTRFPVHSLSLPQPLSISENPFDQCLPVPACRGSAVRFWSASHSAIIASL